MIAATTRLIDAVAARAHLACRARRAARAAVGGCLESEVSQPFEGSESQSPKPPSHAPRAQAPALHAAEA
ncbi:MAG: hypothetical protein R3F14_23065 [Polyangiaceae bacterium]